MSLISALNSAVSGLRANQVGLDVVSRNVANAGTEGYTKKVAPRENAIAGNEGIGVRTLAVQRNVDFHLQHKLRSEESRMHRLDVVSDFLRRVDDLFGKPHDETSIAADINKLATNLSAMIDAPENAGVRSAVVARADAVARNLNYLSTEVQNMRGEAERGIAASVEDVNISLQAIADLNKEIANRKAFNLTTADLEDRRDLHVQTVAANMDIRYIERTDGALQVFTNSGHTLVSDRAARLEFDSRQVLTPETLYSANAEENGVGVLKLIGAGGTTIDLMQDGPPRHGKIAAYLELRDDRLVEAQNQLDEIAHSLTTALQDQQVGLSPSAFDPAGGGVNLSTVFPAPNAAVRADDRLSLTLVSGGRERTLTAYFVSPLPADTSTLASRVVDPDNAVFVDANAANLGAALETALDSKINGFASPSAGHFAIEDSLRPLVRDITFHRPSLSTSNGPQLNVFRDGNGITAEQRDYSGSISGDENQKRGYAMRISVNTAVASDTQTLVSYTNPDGSTVPVGDVTRPKALLDRLVDETMTFAQSTGLGGTAAPYRGTVLDLASSVVSYQGMESANVTDLASDQKTRTKHLDERFTSASGVNVDDEMAQLIMLQSAYAASAKVVQTVDQMLAELLSMR